MNSTEVLGDRGGHPGPAKELPGMNDVMRHGIEGINARPSMELAPFRQGHVRRRQPCRTCGQPTRRTVPSPSRGCSRYVLRRGCELPSTEERLLMAIFNVGTLPGLEAVCTQREAGR